MRKRDKIIRVKQITFLTCFVMLIFNMIGFFLSQIQPIKYRVKVDLENPFAFVRDEEYWASISDYCVKDNYIYLLYGTKGILKIYNSEGDYIRSFAFLERGSACHLNVRENEVYLNDQDTNYYVFADAEFIRFFERPEQYTDEVELRKSFVNTEEKRTDVKGKYTFLYNSTVLVRGEEDGRSAFVYTRSILFAFCQGITPLIITAVMIAILANLRWIP